MVRDSLEQPSRLIRSRLDQRTGLVAIGVVGVGISLSSALWIGVTDAVQPIVSPSSATEARLSAVTMASPTRVVNPSQSRPPEPPDATQWSSPLGQECADADNNIKEKLNRLKDKLPDVRQRVAIDSSNYGKRYHENPWQEPIDPNPRVVVLHETSHSLSSAVNTFQTHHPHDADQVSYHTLISRNGEIVDVVDPLYRAFGAGYSAFLGEWAVTNPHLMGSVNNFALHLSLETPRDGYTGAFTHSGYTAEQYDALAVVLDDWMERFGIDARAITTHAHVDLGGERGDPRSFEWDELQKRMTALHRIC